MSQIDSDFLIIAAVCISLFFLITASFALYGWIMIRRVLKKAELAIEGVESVTSVMREVGRSAHTLNLLKLIRFISKLARRA